MEDELLPLLYDRMEGRRVSGGGRGGRGERRRGSGVDGGV